MTMRGMAPEDILRMEQEAEMTSPIELERIPFEQIREIRKKQEFLDPEPSADRNNAMVQAGADTQLEADNAKIPEIQAEEREKVEDAIFQYSKDHPEYGELKWIIEGEEFWEAPKEEVQ